MTNPSAPQRIAVGWSAEARADLRAIDRDTAVQIPHCVDRYLASRTGDVKMLKPPLTGFRLRCGSYPLFFDLKDETQSGSLPSAIAAKPTGKMQLRIHVRSIILMETPGHQVRIVTR
ncbi:MAG: hypothetical protein WBS24_07505, partial [Terriglobales bacterium]